MKHLTEAFKHKDNPLAQKVPEYKTILAVDYSGNVSLCLFCSSASILSHYLSIVAVFLSNEKPFVNVCL